MAKKIAMRKDRRWTREELILAINLYCKISFGTIHNRNPKIIRLANLINRTPNSVSYKLANIASIDPSLPRKGASHYSKLDFDVWNEFFGNSEKLVYESEQLLWKYERKTPQKTTTEEPKIGLEKESVVKTRVNQAFFRKMILASYDFKCCLTGLTLTELLVASHIIPWSKDEKNRLNPRNGLCLNALHDKAFDAGLITLSDNYRIVLSKKTKKHKTQKAEQDFIIKFENQKINLPDRFVPAREFLSYHRNNIFLG